MDTLSGILLKKGVSSAPANSARARVFGVGFRIVTTPGSEIPDS
jgi:hypothetical protein